MFENHRSIGRQGKRLTLERPGNGFQAFKATDTPGRFVHEANSRSKTLAKRASGKR